MTKEKEKKVGAIVQKTIGFLFFLQKPRSIKEIAEHLKFNVRGAYRYLQATKEAGVCLFYNEKDKTYCLLEPNEEPSLLVKSSQDEDFFMEPSNLAVLIMLDKYIPTDDEFFPGDLELNANADE